MTAKEAMLHIASHNAAHSRRERFAVHITEALNVAVEALKKRVPMVPVRDSLADRACPACNAYIPFDALNDRITDAPRFCKQCGQALDWGENDV